MSIITEDSAPFLRQLVGKKVIVVGGSYGYIGYAVAQAALEYGARVVLTSRSQSTADAAVERLLATNARFRGSVSGLAFDATDPAQLSPFWDRVGAFDHLIWTAGDALLMNFMEDSIDRQRAFFDVRFWGPVHSVKYAYKKGLIRPGGSITLSIGTSFSRPHVGGGMVASLCGAIDALTRALAVDLAPIRVNVVNAGLVDTPLWDVTGVTGPSRAAMMQHVGAASLVKHTAQPEEIADAYIYCMKCTNVTGQTVTVEGGSTLVWGSGMSDPVQ